MHIAHRPTRAAWLRARCEKQASTIVLDTKAAMWGTIVWNMHGGNALGYGRCRSCHAGRRTIHSGIEHVHGINDLSKGMSNHE